MHSVANIATLQTSLAFFLPFQKAPKLYLFSKNRWYCRASARRGLAVPALTHLSLALSLCVSLVQCTAAEVQRSVKQDIMLLF